MRASLQKRLETVYTVVDWFIPEPIRQNVELVQRVRMFVISHMFGPFLGHPITISLYLVDPEPNPHVPILGLSILAFWFFPIALRITGRYPPLALLSVQNLTFATLWGCYFYGGVSSPFMPWLLMVPLLAFYYLGAAFWYRVAVIGIICGNMAIFYIAYLMFGFPLHVPLSEMVLVGMVSVLCSAIYVSLMAVYYANVTASESELQREVRRHRITMAELRGAKDAAEQANNAKSEFLAKMSHELRTPLNAIIGYSEMLLEDAEIAGRGEEIADLEKINRAGRHLLSLLTDVLDLSKIEAGKMDLYVERFELPKFIDDVASTCRSMVANNANELVVRQSPDVDVVACDMTKLRQVVINLLSNAGKFTKNGRVSLETALEKRGQEQWFAIRVRDTGIGIRETDMARLFQDFSQADAGISSQFGGTGLGLALSRRLCRIMGGDISVESEFGKGACFSIRLPVISPILQAGAAALDNSAGAITPAEHLRPTVLVIDDDQAVLELMDRILTKEGYEAILTDSPDTGLRLARDIRPAAIVVDVVLPEQEDWAVLKALKEEEKLRGCPVIVQSMIDDRKTGFDLGADEYLLKPIDREALLSVLDRLVPRDPPGSVLLIDDTDIVPPEVVSVLTEREMPISNVKSCAEALPRVRLAPPIAILVGRPSDGVDVSSLTRSLVAVLGARPLPVLISVADSATGGDDAGFDDVLHIEGRSPKEIADEMQAILGGTSSRHGEVLQESLRA